MSEQEALFDIPRSRFTKEPAEIERMLQWHAQITTELQRRVLEAAQYLLRRSAPEGRRAARERKQLRVRCSRMCEESDALGMAAYWTIPRG